MPLERVLPGEAVVADEGEGLLDGADRCPVGDQLGGGRPGDGCLVARVSAPGERANEVFGGGEQRVDVPDGRLGAGQGGRGGAQRGRGALVDGPYERGPR